MKKVISVLIFSLGFLAVKAQDTDNNKINIVFILADDLGWADVTLYGKTKFYETPNLERLAARGMTFNRAYAASPLCSPTRASILTGQTPARTGITSPAAHQPNVQLKASRPPKAAPDSKSIACTPVTRLDTIIPTLGKLLKADGYNTAHFGKWHLGRAPYTPIQHGFDMDVPHWPGPGPAGSFVAPWKYPNFKANYEYEHIEDRMADEAINWLRSRDLNTPFFMNYWQFSVHAPFDAKESLIKYYQTKIDFTDLQHSPTYAAMVHSLDQAVGRLLDEIDRLGISDNTAIIFFSDNGGNMYNGIRETSQSGEEFITEPTSNRPLRGGKATIYEGGTRVPCIVVWPKLTVPESRSDVMIQSTDFYPTILNQLGIQFPKKHKIDGVDITEALKGKDQDRGPIITYFPHNPKIPNCLPPSVAVHDGDWKLIRVFNYGKDFTHQYFLYNLKQDIGEVHNLTAKYPDKVKELDAIIEAHLKDTKAVVPIANPAFDPQKYHPEDIGIQKGGLRVAKRIEHNKK
ncbi:Arylsulfatase A [Hyunsoonleella jejuensis]|uniref:Arylsulfatase A n=1 Tax=Hyunsoonleella jejuensis TaxID=419940 RepID=A0A1H9IRM8_9FLAO|nr:sulfatase [Hyunsoonleella jejuensis]SEQ77169.1 Arylsulfatase A [Hyunsoonleella jejuensis]